MEPFQMITLASFLDDCGLHIAGILSVIALASLLVTLLTLCVKEELL